MAHVLGDAVAAPPTDGVTRVRFSPTASNYLLVSSWDGTVRLYDPSGAPRGVYVHQAPLLDCSFEQEGVFYSGGLDCRIARVDAATSQQYVLGAHAAPIKCVEWLPERGAVVTAGWDSTLRLWDPRLPPQTCNVATAELPGKAYALGAGDGKLVVGTAGRHVLVYDVSLLELGEAAQTRESSLKYQTRCIAAHSRGYALGSVEGRVAMEVFDPSPEAQRAKYAFKCHRRNEGGRDAVYPVHAIAYHPVHGTFATGGGDGVVNVWDGDNKKRLFQVAPYPTSVASLAFSADGALLAVAASYCHERGEGGGANPPDAVFIRKCGDAEVRPKPRVAAA